jgi:hypothetical protein
MTVHRHFELIEEFGGNESDLREARQCVDTCVGLETHWYQSVAIQE